MTTRKIEYNRKWRAENREKRTEYMRKWRAENKDKIKCHNKKYMKTHQEELKAKRKKYYQENKEKIIKANRKWVIENPQRVKEIRKKSYDKVGRITDLVKMKAQNTANCRIKIEDKLCEDCNDKAQERHHEDYDKPLEVVLLCKKCHNKRHTKR